MKALREQQELQRQQQQRQVLASDKLAQSSRAASSTPSPAAGGAPLSDSTANTRTASSCSTSTTTAPLGAEQAPNVVGQCRICRKSIATSEPCHLCSKCDQFVCDDCASYSASDQVSLALGGALAR